ncbi:MAG: flagellar motor switch protein FliN [Planctomycetota bacterium]
MADPEETPNPDPEAAGTPNQTGDADDAQAADAGGDTATAESDANASSGDNPNFSQADIEKLLDEATDSLAEAAGTPVSPSASAEAFSLSDLTPAAEEYERQPIDLLGEVEMDLRIELGRTEMRLEEVLQLRNGSVVALDKLAGDPVDIFVNGRLIARGEVLVMNDNFCIRVTELVGA